MARKIEDACIVCGGRADVGIGGLLLCTLHAAEFQEWAAVQRAAGRSVDAARWALGARRSIATTIRLAPQIMDAADRLAEERGLSRSKLIEVLIEQAAAGG